jgi:hypothetical protein
MQAFWGISPARESCGRRSGGRVSSADYERLTISGYADSARIFATRGVQMAPSIPSTFAIPFQRTARIVMYIFGLCIIPVHEL